MDDLPTRIARLSPTKRRLFAKKLGDACADAFPLSSAQERLWFLDQLAPRSPAYNLTAAVKLQETLDLGVLERALAWVVVRHESLRTCFVAVDGVPLQLVLPPTAVPVRSVDVPPGEPAEPLLRAEAQGPFDLTRAPLLRAVLFRTGDGGGFLQVTLHHIVSDEWSFGILLRELQKAYQAFGRGDDPTLPPLLTHYGDFAAWQRQRLASGGFDEGLGYWAAHLAQTRAAEIPGARTRPAIRGPEGDQRGFLVDQSLSERLQELSRSAGTTLFMTLLAAFQVLVQRYSGEEQFNIGTPFADRPRREFEPCIGFFVNLLVLRADLRGRPSFLDLLQRTREDCLAAYAHADVPFERVVQRVQPTRDLSRHPLFDVLFGWQTAPRMVAGLDRELATVVPVDPGVVRFDLEIYVGQHRGVIQGSVAFATGLFDGSMIGRLINHYQRLLEAIATDPQQPISALPLLTSEEAAQLAAWNDTAVSRPPELLVHNLVAERLRRAPRATAVSSEEGTLTAAELDARTQRLSDRLCSLGIAPDHPVGIDLERSLDAIVAMLGVLQAGGAFLPLDPESPWARRCLIAREATPFTVITRGRGEAWSGVGLRALDLAEDPLSELHSPPAGGQSLHDHHLAYVMFTSGSTGRPKGVMISHRAVCNRLLWMQERYAIGPEDRVLHKTPLTFDVAVWEVFWPLISDATLVLARPGGHRDARYLVEVIEREQITVVHFVPSMLQVFLEQHDLERCRSLRHLICSGEELSLDLVRRAQQRLAATVHNLYGPTEAAIDITAWTCLPDEPGPRVPIGTPIANCRTHVLDRYGNHLPIGMPGELHLAGDGLARGYLDQPELTADRFVPDAFDQRPGARMYRTGDLVRRRSDGALEFLGRLDRQVKIRGQRVELGEVEAAIRTVCPGAEVVVLGVAAASGEQALVAYVVPPTGQGFASDALKAELRDTLPRSMTPAAIVPLDRFPLTPNGKLDVRALPLPAVRPEVRAASSPEGLTPTERRVIALCSDVLGHNAARRVDDFFEVGGSSLQAARLVARLSSELGWDVPVRLLFEHPILGEFAGAVDTHATEPQARTVRSLARRSGDLPGFVKIEGSPLQTLVRSGHREPLRSAALVPLPGMLVAATGRSQAALLAEWGAHLPMLCAIIRSPLGSIGLVLLPIFEPELHGDPVRLRRVTLEGARLAASCGAQVVSLTGLLGSATGYATELRSSPAPENVAACFSTGHATTAAAVVLSMQHLLVVARRRMQDEHLGVLGVGSIGSTSLRLAIKTLPHPRAISLCDLAARGARLDAEVDALRHLGFSGPIRVVPSAGSVPADFYAASVMLAATSAPDVLRVDRLAPGTLLIDDSYPHSVRTDAAFERMKRHADFLCTEGGIVRGPDPFAWSVHVPEGASPQLAAFMSEGLLRQDAREITGCILSSLLSARFSEAPVTVGVPTVGAAVQHLTLLQNMGFGASDLQLAGQAIDTETVRAFSSSYGT